MSCARALRLLDAWLDHELDASTRDAIADHVAHCPSCAALQSERAELRDVIRSALDRYTPPPAFVAELRRVLARADTLPARQRNAPSWWTVMAGACMAAFAGAFTMFAWLNWTGLEDLRPQAVASHVAALAAAEGRAERLVQVAASDRHVVKPWFQGKVDFAPPVRDLAGEGFTLLGARLDRIGGQPAAVIVYRIRNHPIDLFVWRAHDAAPRAVELGVDRGYSVATWAEPGLRFAAVSDVDRGDLERFARSASPVSAGSR